MSKIILIALLCVSALALAQERKTKRPTGERYFFANGKHFAKVAGKTREPKQVIDTVNIVAGQGTLILNKNFNREGNSVVASSRGDLFATVTGILDDISSTVYSYSCYISKAGDSVIVKSSGGAADTSKVAVQIVLK